MNKKIFKKALLPALLTIGLSTPATALADFGDIAVGVKGGTPGLGAEVTVGLLSKLNFRTGYNAFNYDGNTTESDIDYNYKLKLKSIPLLLDYHPFDNGFRVTSGIFINNNEVTAVAEPNGLTIDIGGTTYDVTDIGTLDAKIDFRTTAPYLGIGWGNPVSEGSQLTITLDLGVIFQGKPKVSMEATGAIASDPAFQADLDKETADLKEDVESIEYYPVISLGVAYRF